MFNSREIALIIWVFIAFTFITFSKSGRSNLSNIRKSISRLLESIINLKLILIPMAIYLLLGVIILYKIGFWNISLLKDTFIWVIFSAFAYFLHMDEVNSGKKYFRTIIYNSIGVIIFIEFLTNLYTFELAAELIILPFIFLTVGIKAYTEIREDQKLYRRNLDSLLSILMVFMLGFNIYKIIVDFDNFASISTLREFSLPIILTIIYLPFLYLTALFITYDSIYSRLGGLLKQSSISGSIKVTLFRLYGFNVWNLKTASKSILRELFFLETVNEHQVLDIIKKYGPLQKP